MLLIIVQLRAMQLYTQHAHNLCSRVPFFQDHEFFGETYPQLDSDYDSVVERQIGLNGEEGLDLSLIIQHVYTLLSKAPTIGVKENKVFFMKLLEMEKELCEVITQEIASGASEGTKQLLGDICDKSEVRQYKIKQRIK